MMAAAVLAQQLEGIRDLALNYGKHLNGDSSTQSNSLYKLISDFKVPKSWFIHFYIVGILCNMACLLYNGNNRLSFVQSLFMLHLVRRVIECYAFQINSGQASSGRRSQMLIIHYFIGISFYMVTSLVFQTRSYGTSSTTFLNVIALILFTGGQFIQFQAHSHLASLQKYTVPMKSWFKYSSNPHYLAEIMIFTAFLLFFQFDACVIACMVWVVVNLSILADSTHQLYLKMSKSLDSSERNIVHSRGALFVRIKMSEWFSKDFQ
ncbi:hypothetical protein MP228_008255 [Amoeboaphelidium protococcarum]|nr:hypothetical protein MP228_008255 [Amoeboaphelidium protococcarum]